MRDHWAWVDGGIHFALLSLPSAPSAGAQLVSQSPAAYGLSAGDVGKDDLAIGLLRDLFLRRKGEGMTMGRGCGVIHQGQKRNNTPATLPLFQRRTGLAHPWDCLGRSQPCPDPLGARASHSEPRVRASVRAQSDSLQHIPPVWKFFSALNQSRICGGASLYWPRSSRAWRRGLSRRPAQLPPV